MKKFKQTAAMLLALALTLALVPASLAATLDKSALLWDGKPAALETIGENLGYDLVDSKGEYKPMYTFAAESLWYDGLFLGSNGCFDLDRPMTRVEGIIMSLRLLGLEAAALESKEVSAFTDVPDWARHYVGYAVKIGITKGISDTLFGTDNILSAKQYITFVIRALGYVDNVDFTYDKAEQKALELGLIGEPCFNQYTRSNLFLRDNAAVISYNALNGVTKAGEVMREKIALPGKPAGEMPYATAELKLAAVKAAEEQAAKEAEEKAALEELLASLVYYADFPDTPSYLSVDETAVQTVEYSTDTTVYYRYTEQDKKGTQYESALKFAGFSYGGTLVVGPSGNYTVYWYYNGKTVVCCGNYGSAYIVRATEYEINGSAFLMSANDLREIWALLNK